MKNIKMIAFDLDGTLTQHKTPLSSEYREILYKLKKKYILVMVGAGQVRRIFEQMNQFPIDIIGNYGMQYARYNYDIKDLETVYDISKKAMNYIDLHYLENITLEDIANHLFISRKYLNSVFKKETNFTVKNYIIHRRIIQAKLYLRDQNASVQEAFSSSGFSDYSNFFKHFKKIVGMTPKQYQKYFLAYQKNYYKPELLEKFNSDLTDE